MAGPACFGPFARLLEFEIATNHFLLQRYPVLEEILGIFQSATNFSIEIKGHTNSIGNYDENHWSSRARAEAVFGWLEYCGISLDRMHVHGYGPDRPIADNGTDEGRAKNRRVEIIAF